MNKFKKGDKVKCINPINGLTSDKIYLVVDVYKGYTEPGIIVIGDFNKEEQVYEKRFELVPEDRKIIGYRLLKDTPGSNKGSIVEFNPSKNKWQSEGRFGQTNGYTNEMIKQPEWFEPIYEEVTPKSVKLKLGSNQIEVVVYKDSVSVPNVNLLVTIDTVENLYEEMIRLLNRINMVGQYNVAIITDERCIRIGCQNENNRFSLKELEQVLETSKSL